MMSDEAREIDEESNTEQFWLSMAVLRQGGIPLRAAVDIGSVMASFFRQIPRPQATKLLDIGEIRELYVAVSADGKRVFFAYDLTLVIIDAETRKEINRRELLSHPIAIAVSRTGGYYALQLENRHLRVYDSRVPGNVFVMHRAVHSFFFLEDERQIAVHTGTDLWQIDHSVAHEGRRGRLIWQTDVRAAKMVKFNGEDKFISLRRNSITIFDVQGEHEDADDYDINAKTWTKRFPVISPDNKYLLYVHYTESHLVYLNILYLDELRPLHKPKVEKISLPLDDTTVQEFAVPVFFNNTEFTWFTRYFDVEHPERKGVPSEYAILQGSPKRDALYATKDGSELFELKIAPLMEGNKRPRAGGFEWVFVREEE